MTITIKYAYPVSESDARILHLLYQPIIKKEAISVYLTLSSLFSSSQKKPLKTDLYDLCGMNPESFEEAIIQCVSVGLMDYDKKKEIVYLHPVLSAKSFFDSPLYAHLKTRASTVLLSDLKRRLLPEKNPVATSLDAFKKIHGPLQEKKGPFEGLKSPLDVDSLLDSLPHVFKEKINQTEDLKNMMHHVAYLYDLNAPEMNELMIQFLKEDTLSFEKLSDLAHKSFYEKAPSKTFDVHYFKKAHPKEVLKDLTGSHVPLSDIKTVDMLIQNSGLKLEVINVLLAYVVSELNGQMPVYKYFEKVSGQWHRNQILTAEEAIGHIKTTKQKSTKKITQKGSQIPWFDDYLKEKEDVK